MQTTLDIMQQGRLLMVEGTSALPVDLHSATFDLDCGPCDGMQAHDVIKRYECQRNLLPISVLHENPTTPELMYSYQSCHSCCQGYT